MKKRLKILGLMTLVLTSFSYAGDREDISFLNELYKQGRYEFAVQESKKFIIKYPESKYNKSLAERIGIVNYLSKNYQESKKYFEFYLKKYKLSRTEKREAYSYLYRVETFLGNLKNASLYIEEIKKSKELWEETLIESGILVLNNNRNKEAIELFNKAIALNGKSLQEAYLYRILAYTNIRDYQRARQSLDIYNSSKVREKDLPLITYLTGVINYKTNKITAAITSLEKGIGNYPNNPYTEKGRVSLVEIYLNIGEEAKAMSIYSSIKVGSSKDVAAKILGNYFVATSNYSKAIEYFEKIKSKDEETKYACAYAFFKKKNYERAIVEFSKVTESRSLEGKYYTIISYYEQEKYLDVLNYENYLKNFEMDSKKYIDIKLILGNSAYKLKKKEKALKYYYEIYKDYPEIENLYRALVSARDVLNEEIVLALFEDYKKNYQGETNYKKNIYILVGEFYYKKDRILEAEKTYIDYLKLNKDMEITEKLIDLLINQKKYSKAIEYLNILEVSDESLYLKGVAYMGIGRYEKASENLNKISKTSLSKELSEKVKYTSIKNSFLWEKYEITIKEGEAYLLNKNLYREDDIIDTIALSYYRLGKFSKARENFLKLEKYKNQYSYLRYQIAETYLAEKNYKKSVELFKEISDNKNFSTTYKETANYNLILSYLYLNENSKVLEESKNFIRVYPNSDYNKNLIMIRGTTLEKDGNIETAILEYQGLYSKEEEIIEKDRLIKKIIILYTRVNDNINRKVWIDKLNDKVEKAYEESLYYRDEGLISQAKEVEKILIESEKYKDYTYKLLGDEELELENYEEALKYYEKINGLKVTSYKDYVTYKIGEIYFKTGKYEEAIVEFTKVFILYPDSQYKLISKLKISEIFEIQKENEKSIKAYKEVYQEDTDGIYREYLVEKILFLNLKLENYQEAKSYYEELKLLNLETSLKYKNFMEPEIEENKNTDEIIREEK